MEKEDDFQTMLHVFDVLKKQIAWTCVFVKCKIAVLIAFDYSKSNEGLSIDFIF